jgi:photosystem II stability/assembly factor-like uncharacterized protein
MSELALLAGGEEGLYILRSRDGGQSWQEAETAIPEADVAVVQRAPDGTVYAGTRDRGFFRSRNGLRSWESVETPPELSKVRSLAIYPDRFLVGSEARPAPVGVFEWEDGEEWRPLGDLSTCSGAAEWSYPVATEGVHIRHLSRDPHDPQRLYAAMQVGGVAISPDGGQSWYDRRNLDLDCHMVEGHPTRPGVVFAGCGGAGLYRSADYGDTWDLVSEGCGRFVVQFAMDPQQPDRLFLGTAEGGVRSWDTDPAGARGQIWRSDDAGDTWHKVTGGLPVLLRSRPGALHIAPSAPSNIFFSGDLPRGGPDSGVYHSADAGETWRKLAPLPKIVSLTTLEL